MFKLWSLLGGAFVFAVLLFAPNPTDMPLVAWKVTAVAVLMAIWWISETIPVPVTALLPVILFPFLGIVSIKFAAAPYAHPLIFLFLGGFIIALCLERWNLHRRVALTIVLLFGTRPTSLIAGFMLATAVLSMWVSNTATTVMMLPIGLSIITLFREKNQSDALSSEDGNLAIALLLGIAYAASIGGLGTLIGTPPNALLAAYMSEKHGVTIGFGQWMLIGLPAVIVLLPLAWLVLTRIAYPVGGTAIPGAAQAIREERRKMGPMTTAGKRVALVFFSTALLWILRPAIDDLLPGFPISDSSIALLGALALFIIPAGPGRGQLMDWDTATKLPWGTLILFGGGLSLASAMSSSGLAKWIGAALTGFQAWPLAALILLFVVVIVFLTELTSNTATASVFLPVGASFAVALGYEPLLFAVPIALSASCAFMMPVATPPNAIVFGSGHVSIPQMVRAGFLLNILAAILITGGIYLAGPALIGILGNN